MNTAPEIIAQPPCALRVMSEAGGLSDEQSQAIMLALVRAGFAVVPREPTNSMFDAYIAALQKPSRFHKTIIQHIGKARKRWKAMVDVGQQVAFSRRADINGE